MGVSQNYGYLLGGPNNKDYRILGSIWGPLILGNYHIGSGFRVWGLPLNRGFGGYP